MKQENIKYLEVLFDLLWIGGIEEYLKVAQEIESNSDLDIKTYHKYGFIFEAFQTFLKGDITVEEFMQVWDIDSRQNISLKLISQDAINFIEWLIYAINNNELESYKQKMFVIDKITKPIFEKKINKKKVDNIKIYFC